VTVIAGVAARNVSRVLACGGDAVVTGATIPDYLGVINGDWRCPYRRVMAIFTDICRLNVSRALAGRIRTIVATDTIAEDVHVVENCRRPGMGCVTVVAGIAACNMSRVLTGGANAVVAADAVSGKAGVIEYSG